MREDLSKYENSAKLVAAVFDQNEQPEAEELNSWKKESHKIWIQHFLLFDKMVT